MKPLLERIKLFQKLFRNVFFVWVGFASQVVITFFLTPFMISSLGAEGYGIWVLMQSLTGYYGLIDIGLRAGVTQTVTRRLASNDPNAVLEYFNGIYPLLARVALFLVVIGLVAGMILHSTLTLSQPFKDIVVPLTLIQSVGLAITMLFFPFGAVLPGLQRYDVSESIAFFTRIMSALILALALTFSLGLVGVAIAILIGNLIDQVARLIAAIYFVPQLKNLRPRASNLMVNNLYRVGGWNFVIQLSHQLLHRLNAILVGYMFSVSQIVPFNLAGSLSEHGNRIVTISMRVLFPLFTQLDESKRHEETRTLFVLTSKLCLAFSLMVAVIGTIWMEVFLGLWLRSVPDKDAVIRNARSLFLIFALINATGALRGVSGQMLMGKDRLEFMGKVMIFETVLAIMLSFLFSLFVGLQGLPIGNLFAFCSSLLLFTFPQSAKIIRLPWFDMLKSILLRPMLYNSTLGMITYFYVKLAGIPSNWTEFILFAIFPTFCFCLMFSPILLNSVERKAVFDFLSGQSPVSRWKNVR